jgi:6-phosphogluconolactonase
VRPVTVLLATTLLAGAAPAAGPTPSGRGDTVVYVSVAAEKRIAVYGMDRATGRLTHRGDTKLDGEPGALVADPGRRILFAALRAEGKLASLRIHPGTGALTHVSTVPAGPDPAHLSTDSAGRYLLAAYYIDAKVTVHAVGKDGSLGGKPLQSLPTAEKANAVVPDPSGRFVFVPHTGPDVIFQFTFDPARGRLTPNAPARLTTPRGTGPRHLVFHPSLPIAYVANEQGGSVTACALDQKRGTLRPLKTVPTLPKDFRGANACAEIRVHPSGRFLYVSNCGHDSIACFALDRDGKVSALGQEPTEKTPRSFDLDPAGKYLFAAGESSGRLAAYRIDGESGRLKRLATCAAGKTPWWVLAVELPAPAGGPGEKSGGKQRGKPVKELILPGESHLKDGRLAFVFLPAKG